MMTTAMMKIKIRLVGNYDDINNDVDDDDDTGNDADDDEPCRQCPICGHLLHFAHHCTLYLVLHITLCIITLGITSICTSLRFALHNRFILHFKLLFTEALNLCCSRVVPLHSSQYNIG